MVISRIRARNWKNFRDAEASLTSRTFLIGPNASGKSNFLDILRFLREVATRGLEEAVAARDGVSAIRCLAAGRYPDIVCEVDIADDDGQLRWTYHLAFSQDSRAQPIVKAEQVRRAGKEGLVLDRPEPADHHDALRLTQTALQQVNANKEFREIADFLATISYQHIVPQAVRDPKGFTGGGPVQNDPYGRDFLLRVYTTQTRTRTARLRNITAALKVAVPSLTDLTVEMDDHGVPHLKGRFSHWRARGAYQSEAQFSDGTLRLLGLLWVLFEGTGPILLEEPELSLHADVVRHLPGIFAGVQRIRQKARRQIIISTHSGEMLQDKGIAAEEVLWIAVTKNGSVLRHASDADKEMMRSGMSAADVLLPQSAPRKMEQLILHIE